MSRAKSARDTWRHQPWPAWKLGDSRPRSQCRSHSRVCLVFGVLSVSGERGRGPGCLKFSSVKCSGSARVNNRALVSTVNPAGDQRRRIIELGALQCEMGG